MAQEQAESEMTNFFDFSDAAMPDISQIIAEYTSGPSGQSIDASAIDTTGNLLDGSLPLGFPNTTSVETGCIVNTDSTGAEQILRVPKWSSPAVPCEYCRAMKLDCFFTYDDQESCGACNALFRPCNLKYDRVRPMGVMDTLHPVTEDQAVERGTQTGIINLKSMSYAGGPRVLDEDSRVSGRKNGIRFSRANIKILKDWMLEHRDHPYPTEEEREELGARTGLTATQISNWFANTRRRTKQSTRSRSPSMPTPIGSNPISIRPNRDGVTHRSKEWETLTPMDRWKISPPENEPAKVEDIAVALATTDLEPSEAAANQPSRAPHSRGGLDSSANSDSLSQWQARSTANSQDTGLSLVSSGSYSNISLGSALSHGSSRNSLGSAGGRVHKERRRRRRTAANPSKRAHAVDSSRIFHCTFCTDTFKSKYDWARHEKSLHLSLEKWFCSPIGEVITDPETGARKCVFCDHSNPDANHLEKHNYRGCEEKGREARTFYRKDHLRQHLRLMHGCKMTPAMEAWKSEATYIKCRCGFCGAEFTRWSDRVDHLAKHFRNGSTMKEWRGCRGLEPCVAAHVTNAMPPYLIANESKSPFPFSATNESSIRHHNQYFGIGKDIEAIILNSEGFDSNGQMASHGSTPSLTTPSLTVSPTMQTPASGGMSAARVASYNAQAASRVGVATTCWEILTVRLGKFVADHMRERPNEPLTDDVLQTQARHILYDDTDPWNQTAADNPEWLSLFKQAHGVADASKALNSKQRAADFGEDLGVGELTFDQFFDQADDFGMGGLTFAGDADGNGNLLATTSAADMDLFALTAPPMMTSHEAPASILAATPAMDLDLDFAQLQREIQDSEAVKMMAPAVSMMADQSNLHAHPNYMHMGSSGRATGGSLSSSEEQMPPMQISDAELAQSLGVAAGQGEDVSMEKMLSRLMGH